MATRSCDCLEQVERRNVDRESSYSWLRWLRVPRIDPFNGIRRVLKVLSRSWCWAAATWDQGRSKANSTFIICWKTLNHHGYWPITCVLFMTQGRPSSLSCLSWFQATKNHTQQSLFVNPAELARVPADQDRQYQVELNT